MSGADIAGVFVVGGALVLVLLSWINRRQLEALQRDAADKAKRD